jgi:hypothetical protein
LDSAPNLGFLSVIEEGTGFYGGYLVTNNWGRPLEFRLSSAVEPNRVQRILYGPTLRPYICGGLIAKSLIEKSTVPAQLILADCDAVLDLRLDLPTPLAWLAPVAHPVAQSMEQAGAAVKCTETHMLLVHRRFLGDVALIRERLASVEANDWAEPFERIREALAEARKLGATSRAA